MTVACMFRPSAVAVAVFAVAVFSASSNNNNASAAAFVVVPPSSRVMPVLIPPTSVLSAAAAGDASDDAGRRSVLLRMPAIIGGTLTTVASLSASPPPARALVKGNAPPPKSSGSAPGGEKKCRNVEECQEQAERLESERAEEARANATPPDVAPRGSRYRSVVRVGEGGGAGAGGRVAKAGDAVDLRYKVLKLGKRSYDGLSGEGTVVFSRGYGLADDEKVVGDKSFACTLGDPQLIGALSDAVPGMRPGDVRRISILPQMGWRKPGRDCDGGPGGSGAGGELKTDYVVVPTATMVNEEACFDKNKIPFPTAYAEQRRMAQRFDQSLIVEVELVGFN